MCVYLKGRQLSGEEDLGVYEGVAARADRDEAAGTEKGKFKTYYSQGLISSFLSLFIL